jgi:aspartokinase
VSVTNLLVMKFGGASVGSAARMRASAVVSAMSKITGLLDSRIGNGKECV